MKQKKAIRDALWGLGYTAWENQGKDWSEPSITIQEKIDAICKHLGIFIVKTPTVVSAQKQKKSSLPTRGV